MIDFYLPSKQEKSDENTHLFLIPRQLTIYSLRISYMPRTVLATHVKGCGRHYKVISELYLKDIFVSSFQNDVLCPKLGLKFNPSHQGYDYTTKFFGGNSGFLLVVKESRMPPIRNRDMLYLYIKTR